MLLATQCPHCFTSFRVANDQLKLHAGLVRCGACQQTFNGIEYLLAPGAKPALPPNITPAAPALPITEDHAIATTASEAFLPVQVAIPEFEQTLESESLTPFDSIAIANLPNYAPYSTQHQNIGETLSSKSLEFDLGDDTYAPELDDTKREPELDTVADSKDVSQDDSLSQIPLFSVENDDLALHAKQAEPSSPALEQNSSNVSNKEFATEELQSVEQLELDSPVKAWNAVVKPSSIHVEKVDHTIDLEKPDFVIRAEKKQGRSRVVRLAMIILSTILFFSLVAQSIYSFRSYIAGWFPQTKPMLQEACKLLKCRVDLPTQIEAISIESNELQALSNDKNIFSLSIQLQNKSGILQAWPMLELILNDAKDKPVVRRVFTPADYLTNKNDLIKGLGANSDQAIKLYFELSGPKAAGYHVGVFYP